jgi:tetratricopeptide (TPR) repeat protein
LSQARRALFDIARMSLAAPAPPDTDIDFGALPEAIDALLQSGVAAYRGDRLEADRLFRAALATDPSALATYFCLYKIHTYQGDLDEALKAAEAGLAEAARQALLGPDWRLWPGPLWAPDGAVRFALYTLKALAFIRLRRGEPVEARAALARLAMLDPKDSVGWSVVAAIADGVSSGVI